MFVLTGVFHLIHTAFEEYVFLVVENQMIVEMDKKLNNSLETHIKKGQLGICNLYKCWLCFNTELRIKIALGLIAG